MRNDELTLEVLRLIDRVDSQKSLAKGLGVSVGKVNYVLKALIAKGLIKAERFARSQNKRGYVYLLTAKGIKMKIELTERFIEIKKREYEALCRELELTKRNYCESD